MVPALASREPKSAYLFYDCQTDDVRLVLTVLGEAERFGAVLLNGAEVTEVLSLNGRASGVAFVEAESGERLVVEADNVVNATGVWADRIRPEEVVDEEDLPRIAPSRGTHLILDQADLPMGRAACVIPAGEGRAIFALPWYGRTLIGTTDNDYEGDISLPKPAAEDIAYLLDAVNSFFGVSLGRSDLVGAYAGVRPLISTGDRRRSVDISRKAELYETSSGMLTITGGKLTTWRRMAKQTVDRLVEREGREAPCHTAEIPLGMEARAADLEAPEGVGDESVSQLAFRYGHAARDVLDLAWKDPKLAQPIAAAAPTCLPRRRSPLATSRPAASPTCCCAAPGWGSSPRSSCAAPTQFVRSPRRSDASLAGRVGVSGRRPRPGRWSWQRRASTPPTRTSPVE